MLMNRTMKTSNSCRFKLFIINDDNYTDFDLGCALTDTIQDNGYDIFDDVVDLAGEIARELYTLEEGQLEYIIDLDMEYETTRDYFGEYDVEISYTYKVCEVKKSNYFDEE